MSGNLCRCGAYVNIVAGDRARSAPMRPFALRARRTTPATPSRCAGRERRTRAYLGGGTNLVDLMKLGVETPGAAGRRQPACRSTRDRGDAPTAACGSAPACATATWPPTRVVRERYPVLAAGAAGRRLGPAAQHGHGRRQPAAAHPLLATSRTSPSPATSAGPAPAARRATGEHRNLAILGALRRSAWPPTRPTWRSRWPRSTRVVHVRGPGRRPRDPAGRACTGCPATSPTRDTVLEPGELITAVELPPLAVARALGATARCATGRRSRSPSVSVAAALDVGRRRRCATCRIALGGVAHVPWRAERAEAALRGGPADARRRSRAAADAELAAARAAARQRLQGRRWPATSSSRTLRELTGRRRPR